MNRTSHRPAILPKLIGPAILTLAAVVVLGGCAGYQLGTPKPKAMAGIHSLAVPSFTNSTLEPRTEVMVTNSVIKALQADGTYVIARQDKADAILTGRIKAIDRTPKRSVRGNIQATREFQLTVVIEYSVEDRATGATILTNTVSGSTTFFVDEDVQTEERSSIPIAAEQAANRMVSQLSEGW